MTSQTALASTRKTDELFPQKYSNGNAKTSNSPPVEKLTWEVIWLGGNLKTRIFLLRWRIPCGTWPRSLVYMEREKRSCFQSSGA